MTMPSHVTALLALSGLRVPIVQAPIGSAATPELAIAVCRAGGLGGLALTWSSPEEAAAKVAALRQALPGAAFYANFVLHFPCEGLDAALDSGLPIVTFSWGVDAARIARAHRAGAKVGVQVGNAAGARQAIEAGADFVIAQGVEAGGHVQSTTPLATLLPQVVAVAGDRPVIAAGGIASAAAILRVIAAGAAGAMLGTRFLVTREAATHPDYKAALLAAKPEDTAFTNCFDIDWPHAMHRVLRNSTFTAWEAAGSPPPPHRPGEGDIVFRQHGAEMVRYCDTPPGPEAKGDPMGACLYAGTGVGDIDRIEGAGDLVSRFGAEVRAALASAAHERVTR
ncbi:MAG: nitronate monooxygenase [Rhodobacteraceae bacterium]|nr:MAG: nitronate monooxygenase [Paracoccaceae bacterium]